MSQKMPELIPDRPGRAVFISYAHADHESPDPAGRWQAQPRPFDDSREVLVATDTPALVLPSSSG